MIAGPETPKSPQPPAFPQQQQAPPPPAYNHHQNYVQVRPYPVATTPVIEIGVVRVRESAGRRFLRAFCIATFIWLLLSLLAQSTVTALRYYGGGGLFSGKYQWPIVSGVTLQECVQGDSWTPVKYPNSSWNYQSETSFDLPLSSDTLFLLSRGYQNGGLLDVVTSKDQASDSVKVHVDIYYRHSSALEQVKACLLTRKAAENGVGIFTPEWRRDYERHLYPITFRLQFILPEVHPTPLVVKNFETDLPNGRQAFAYLSEKVLFDRVAIHGSNGGIHADGVTVTDGNFRTTNGGIDGTYNSTQNLKLRTTNGSIRVDVGLTNDGDTPDLDVSTSNGMVAASISLLATSKHNTGGSFTVSTTTTNGRLNVDFPASPVDSTLDYNARTSNGYATVSLNPAYEGTFNLYTSNSSPKVEQRRSVEDPSGKKRQRTVHVKNGPIKHVVSGDVSWGGKAEGKVVVSTSNSALLLKV
ncbi:hypothetical protein CPC08DRAFT_724679 [Agrocybe pediades]|nr:hypothetical protein CPC08DRAFT_724679 [Agrocybe pediades]